MTEKKLNEWYEEQGFKGLEKLTRLRCYWYSEEGGYQQFVEVCNDWWFALDKLEKQSIYDEFNGRLYY